MVYLRVSFQMFSSSSFCYSHQTESQRKCLSRLSFCYFTLDKNITFIKVPYVALGGLVVSVLDPDRGRWIFKGDKNPEHHFLRRGSKAVGPMS